MAREPIGDPLDRGTQVGPQARDDLRASLHRQVEESIKRGAKLLLGGRVPEGAGAFYPPTVLEHVKPGMAAFDEETFGPVAAVIHARDEADAIRLGQRFTVRLGRVSLDERPRARRAYRREIEAGCVFVNELVKSDPRLAFRRHQAIGLRAGAFGIRHAGVHEHQERVDGIFWESVSSIDWLK